MACHACGEPPRLVLGPCRVWRQASDGVLREMRLRKFQWTRACACFQIDHDLSPER